MDTDLIEQLCTAAGIIMEEASPIAIVRGGNRADRIRQIANAGRKILALAEDASVLSARHPRKADKRPLRTLGPSKDLSKADVRRLGAATPTH
ncbi:MAG: hypothetical protein H0W65_09795 [Sphingomonas sp.]|uniref:hypothetical protein n=1 Tax=Sphingomonas sp. TaxID=28214 RepID=UPI0017B38794|nr:hypothetical protein [Sphingomonas sp.]MBA3668002.1 hypothetical protein [Sphingomonas sp.]